MTGPRPGTSPGPSDETAATEGQEQAGRRRFAGRALLVFLIALVAAAAFVTVLLLVNAQAKFVIRMDHSVAADLHHYALRHHAFTTAMRVVSDLHTTVVWFVVMALVAGWLLLRRLRRLALFVVVTVVGSSLLNNVVKLAVHRARPHLNDPVAIAGGKSFPSGHAQAAIVGYGVLLAVFLPIIPRRWRGLAVGLATLMVLLVGFSRIALGVHYLSDVIGAFLIGTVWLIGMASAFRTWRREEGKPAPDLDEGLEPEHREQLKP